MFRELIHYLQTVKSVRAGAGLWQDNEGPVLFTGLTAAVKAGFLCALQGLTDARPPLVIMTANRDGIRLIFIRTWPCGNCIRPA